jgi:diguanylate cyclase (GGDEF)-like protein
MSDETTRKRMERRAGADRRQNERRTQARRADDRRANPDGYRGLARFPTTQAQVRRWVRHELNLPADHEQALLEGIDTLVVRQEQLWEKSKADAINALTAAFRSRITQLQQELSAREATVSNITQYFEQIISDLTIRASHDPKTQLMNFARFEEQLEAYLSLEQRGRWCAVGLADINSFKWYNDTLGHAVGDRIIECVARLLREHVRSNDLLAHESGSHPELHARFGGDEFCFLTPNLDDVDVAAAIADRFREAVRLHDWRQVDERLAARPVQIDIGVACLLLGPIPERRRMGRQLARELLAHADRLMYQAKGDGATRAYPVALRVEEGSRIVEITDEAV